MTILTEYYTIPDKRFVLKELAYVKVDLGNNKHRTYYANRWEHMDGQTLTIYAGERLLGTYQPGEWKSCGAFNAGLLWPEELPELPQPLVVVTGEE